MAKAPNSDPTRQAQLDAAEAATALANARKAAAEASTAEQEAASAALKAQIGAPAEGPFKGTTEIGDETGVAEINLLVRQQLTKLAKGLAKSLEAHLPPSGAVILTAGESFPDFNKADALDSRISLAREAALGAMTVSDEARGRANSPSAATASSGPRASSVAPIAAAGLVLGGVNALLGFFRSDHKLGGSTLAIKDRPLLLALGSELLTGNRKIFVEGFLPPASAEQREILNDEFRNLAARAASLRLRIAEHTASIAKIDEALAAAAAASGDEDPVGGGGGEGAGEGGGDGGGGAGAGGDRTPGTGSRADLDSDPHGERSAHEAALAACTSAVALFDALAASVYAETEGVPAIEVAARQKTLRKALSAGGRIVSVKLDGAWGTQVSKQGMLSGLGRSIPLKVSATTAASWAAFSYPEGALLGSGLATERRAPTSIDELS